jgi:mono/diheme cytochrome c family protein
MCATVLSVYGASLHAQVASSTPAPAPTPAAVAGPLPTPHTGSDVYRLACAACHGLDGKGSPVTKVGFAKELPDFTDCKFTTPEPLGDWIAVVHEGGRIRGLDHHMPAFGDALSDADIEAVVRYAWSFCTTRSWPRGDLNFPRAFFTEKAFPENEAVLTTLMTTGDEPAVGNELQFERRIGVRSQFEATVPVEMQSDGESWTHGIGDVTVALRRTFYASLEKGTIFAAGGELGLPTGSESKGLGSGVTIFEPFVMGGQTLGSAGFVQVHAGVEVPSDSSKVKTEGYVRTALGTTFAQQKGFGRSWTPMVEVLWARPSGEASEWDVVPQLQVSLSKLQHVLVSGGVRLPVNSHGERHPQVLTYLLWDWFDGGFFKYWK